MISGGAPSRAISSEVRLDDLVRLRCGPSALVATLSNTMIARILQQGACDRERAVFPRPRQASGRASPTLVPP